METLRQSVDVEIELQLSPNCQSPGRLGVFSSFVWAERYEELNYKEKTITQERERER